MEKSLKTIDFGKMGKKFISRVKNTNHKLDGETFDGFKYISVRIFASACFLVGIKLRIDAKCEISTNLTLPCYIAFFVDVLYIKSLQPST